MKKKGLLVYGLLGIFILCMVLAISASLEYSTRATNREYLNQGLWLVSILGGTLVLFGGMRLLPRLSRRMSEWWKNVLVCALGLLVVTAGLVLRVWVVEHIQVDPASDYETYYNIARLLMDDAMMSPAADAYRKYIILYPHTIGLPLLFLRPVFSIFGVSVKAALYFNLACNMVAVLLAGHIGYRCGGRVCGLLALTVMSLWPSHILFSSMIATEPSFTMLLLIAVELMLSVLDRGENSAFFQRPNQCLLLLPVLGITLAVAGAIRPVAVIALVAYAMVQLGTANPEVWRKPVDGAQYLLRKGWCCVLVVAVFYLMAGKVISGSIENIVMEEPASGLTASGYNMMVGLNYESGGRWNEKDALFFDEQYAQLGSANAAHAACAQEALRRIRQEPENVLDLLVSKFRDMWQTDDFGVDWNLLWLEQQGRLTEELKSLLEGLRLPGRVAWLCVLMYALIGAVQAWRKTRMPRPELLLFILIYCGTALSHMLLETQVRYHYNVIPFLILLASMAVTEWERQIANEPPVKMIPVPVESVQANEDHIRFDMATALRQGQIRVSVSQASAQEAMQNAAPGSNGVNAQAEAAATAEVPADQRWKPAAQAKEQEKKLESMRQKRPAAKAHGGLEHADFTKFDIASAMNAGHVQLSGRDSHAAQTAAVQAPVAMPVAERTDVVPQPPVPAQTVEQPAAQAPVVKPVAERTDVVPQPPIPAQTVEQPAAQAPEALPAAERTSTPLRPVPAWTVEKPAAQAPVAPPAAERTSTPMRPIPAWTVEKPVAQAPVPMPAAVPSKKVPLRPIPASAQPVRAAEKAEETSKPVPGPIRLTPIRVAKEKGEKPISAAPLRPIRVEPTQRQPARSTSRGPLRPVRASDVAAAQRAVPQPVKATASAEAKAQLQLAEQQLFYATEARTDADIPVRQRVGAAQRKAPLREETMRRRSRH